MYLQPDSGLRFRCVPFTMLKCNLSQVLSLRSRQEVDLLAAVRRRAGIRSRKLPQIHFVPFSHSGLEKLVPKPKGCL